MGNQSIKMVSKETNVQKQCRIKTGSLRRYCKEYLSYEKEVENDKKKIEKAEQEGKDEYHIRKLNEVLKETEVMVPHLKEKIIDSLNDLETYVEEHKENEELVDHENLANAVAEIEKTQEKEEEEETEEKKEDPEKKEEVENEDEEMSIS